MDVSYDAREAFADKTKLPTFSVFPAGLWNWAGNRRVVIIATPPETHLSIVNRAIETGVRGIICEKPLASTVREAQRIVDACTEAGVKLIVGHQRRYDVAHAALKQFLEDEVLGKVVSGTCTFPLSSEGGWLNNGTHAADTLSYLLPPSIPAVIHPGEGFVVTIKCERGVVSLDSYGTLEGGYLGLMYDDMVGLLDGSKHQPRCSGEDGVAAVRLTLEAEEQWNAQSGVATESGSVMVARSVKG
jgi:hypothetical protein